MKIKKITFQNFNAYGNQLQTLEFNNDNSFDLIYGKNGSAKSTLKEIIEFAIYGKVINKNLKDLPNRINKNLKVEIDLEINGKNLNIQRALEPTLFKVELEDDDKFSNKANKSKQQELIDELIGIPQLLFNNTIAVSINNFKSFVELSPDDKRKIIDKIFGIEIINKINEDVKNEVKLTNKNIELLNNKIDILNNQNSELKNKIASILKQLKEKIQIDINKIDEKINDLNIINIELSKKEKELSSKINKIEANILKIKNLVQKNKYEQSSIEEKINLFSKNQCPVCGSPFNTDDFKKLLDEYKKEFNEKESLIKEYLVKLNKLDEQLLKYRQKYNEILKEIKNIEFKISELVYEKKSISNKEINDNTSELKSIIKSNLKKIKEFKTDLITFENEKDIQNKLMEIFSDKGFKKYYIKTLLPTINKKIPEYLKKINVNYNVKFDDNFNAKITSLGDEIQVHTLSTGEKKKIDISVLISILYFLKLKIPSINLLFLDEVFSSLDIESIDNLLLILKDLSKELNFHTFVINHSIMDENLFDNCYFIEKINGFSRIKKNI
jgi:exonuclease SbcC